MPVNTGCFHLEPPWPERAIEMDRAYVLGPVTCASAYLSIGRAVAAKPLHGGSDYSAGESQATIFVQCAHATDDIARTVALSRLWRVRASDEHTASALLEHT